MGKHAYLIIANRNSKQLQYLINCIDDSRNDIYLLKDRKSNKINYNFIVQYSSIYYLKPINIYWGSYSLVQAELMLFKAASRKHYDYYHLLSGLDMPLVNQDELHDFFDNNSGNEFLTYGNPKININNRIKHHSFRKHYRLNNKYLNYLMKFYKKIENMFLTIVPQYKIINDKLSYASNWVSIDDKFVQFIVSNIDWIYFVFHDGYIVDELFIPTLLNYSTPLLNSVYYNKPVHNIPSEFQGNLRYINWWDGFPYTWKLSDYSKLVYARNKGHMFSRKFDLNVDSKIFFKIFNDITK